MPITKSDFLNATKSHSLVDKNGVEYWVLENRCKGNVIPTLLVQLSVASRQFELGYTTEQGIIDEDMNVCFALNDSRAYMKNIGTLGGSTPLFPDEYLNEGSSGLAVTLLQLMLKFGGYAPEMNVTGKYREKTAQGVKRLQVSLGFTGDEVDGHFGPATRKALLEQRRLDIAAIREEWLLGKTHVVTPDTAATSDR